MWLLVIHFAVVFTAILLASHLEGAPYLGEREKNTPQRHHAALLIFYSEVINFWFWFVKFTPLFLVLYPIHRAQWYQGGTLADYLLCRKSCCSYKRSQAYKDPQYPRCVRPDTNKISETGLTNLRGLARGGELSTIRRRHDRDAMLSVRGGEQGSLRHGADADAPGRSGGAPEPAWASPVPPPSRLGTRRDSEPLPSRSRPGRRRRARAGATRRARGGDASCAASRTRPARARTRSRPTRRRSPRSRSSCRTR